MKRFAALLLALIMLLSPVNISAYSNANGFLTRGEFAQLLWEASGNPASAVTAPFIDLTTDINITGAINYLYEKEVILGTGNNLFAPNEQLTREMAYVMLSRYFGLAPHNIKAFENFSDNYNISLWARDAAAYIFERHRNTIGAAFTPSSIITREDAAVLIAELSKTSQLDIAIKEIMARLDGSLWGMEFAFPNGESIYSINREQFFQPASTLKIFTAGIAYETLGQDFRFNTAVYGTGSIENGVLDGDLVLLANGDLLFGGRVNPDGSINLPHRDHSFGFSPDAVPVSDFPLGSLYELARQIAARGIREIRGNIIVDNSLFREGSDNLGAGVGDYIISPIMLNDNIIGVWVNPGEDVGEPAVLQILPETPYLTIINEVTTAPPAVNAGVGGVVMQGGAGVGGGIRFENDIRNPDGTRTVTISGDINLGGAPVFRTYTVPEPASFAEAAFHMILEEKGIISNINLTRTHNFNILREYYTEENLLAQLISPTLRYQLMPMMKLSSNLHTVAWPYIVGAIAGDDSENAMAQGLLMQAEMFERTGVKPSIPIEGIQTIAEMAMVLYTPASFTNFLNYLYTTPYFNDYSITLPIMGVDGTLDDVDPNLEASGNVFAKTGRVMNMTMNIADGTRQIIIINNWAGFIELPDGQFVTFSLFSQYSPDMPNALLMQQAAGDIVNLVYKYLTN
ncbi:MAG: D-alanyl-D-alanine carboxypeptidase [Defluviitaleaceae bacterium]|nr:D-alanyl-D-alanine carboxypeptidase [Defluviitaleaceae bacterium]